MEMTAKTIFCILLLGCAINSEDSFPKLHIVTTSQDSVTFSCETTIIPNVDMYLKCPLSRGYCLANCETFCSKSVQNCPNRDLLQGLRCTRRKLDSNRLVVSYTISRHEPKIGGQWFCSYNGVKTDTINMSSTPKPPPPKIRQGRNRPDHIKPPESLTSRTSSSSSSSESIDIIFKGELVMSVIILLLISIVLNLAFCIRCCLTRKYIKMFKDNKFNQLTCLEACLCVKRKKRLNYHKRNSFTNSGTYENHIPLNNARSPSNYSYPIGGSNNMHDVSPMMSSFEPHPPPHSASPSTPIAPHTTMMNMQPALSGSAMLIPASVSPDGQVLYRLQTMGVNPLTGSATALRVSQTLYDEVPGDNSSASSQISAPVRASSLTSLYAKPKRYINPNRMASPLPEETNTLLLQHQKSNQSDKVPPPVEPNNHVLNGYRGSITDDDSSSIRGSASYSGSTSASHARHDPEKFHKIQQIIQKTGEDLHQAESLLD